MQTTVNDLFLKIGRQAVEIDALRAEVQRLQSIIDRLDDPKDRPEDASPLRDDEDAG